MTEYSITILQDDSLNRSSGLALETLFENMTSIRTRVNFVSVQEKGLLRKFGDLVVIPGGEPIKLFKTLGKNGRTMLKTYIANGGKLVYVAAPV
jgi:glutamine amidotransferase-like uncharacterized protein